MPAADARVETPHAAKYLSQLCKHFAHKVPAEFDAAEGRIDLPLGPCHLSASTDSLALLVEAPDEQALANLQWVVASHLKRFAFREGFEVEWRPTSISTA